MSQNLPVTGGLPEREQLPSILEKILSEKKTDRSELKNRWESTINSFFSYLANSVSNFVVSCVKNDEISQIQSCIRGIFRKTDYIEKIRDDLNLQNVFLLGYCHGIDCVMKSFEEQISFRQNDSLKHAISSYKYVEPVLKILDQRFEISHQELAYEIGISESALSNFMRKVEDYHLFNYTRTGKRKYYSLAHPNGETALKIVKENERISADSFTELLLVLIDSLRKISICDELEKDYVLQMCGKMIMQYTTRPALCKKKLEDLALILKSERVYFTSLIVFEGMVKETVIVFTRDISTEQAFRDIILKNLKKNITYQWFLTETEQFDSPEKVEELFLEHFSKYSISHNREHFRKNVRYHIIPKEDTDLLLGDIYDAVIYDEKEGFICEDETISDETPYIRMPQYKIEQLNKNEKEQNNF